MKDRISLMTWLVYIVILSANLPAQELEVKAKTYYRIAPVTITQVGDVSLVESVDGLSKAYSTAQPVGVIRVDTEASNVEMTVSGADRQPIEPKRLTENVYLIERVGKWWVDVTVIDFEKNIYGRKTLLVEVGAGPPPPTPDPPGPNPPTPVPDNVPNEYGVGRVAFEAAPKDVSAKDYAKIYKQAGDFLFGVPSLKFITSSNSSQANDPNRSVLAWIRQQQERVPCTDESACQQWKVWRDKVGVALLESQRKRQFTRQDWFNAFNEISRALGAAQ